MTTVASHDHDTCVLRTLTRAVELAKSRGLRLTPTRRRTLEILLESHVALGAYDLLDRLKAEGLGNRPVIAYRALEFLREHGLVHRIEGLNAFVACTHPDPAHRPAFIVCRSCRVVSEAHVDLCQGPLERSARRVGVKIERTVIEALGICESCRFKEGDNAD